MNYDSVCTDLRSRANRNRAEQLCPRPNGYTVSKRWVPFPSREARSTERHSLVEGHVVADLCRLTDNDAHSMINEQPLSNLGSRVNLYTGQEP